MFRIMSSYAGFVQNILRGDGVTIKSFQLSRKPLFTWWRSRKEWKQENIRKTFSLVKNVFEMWIFSSSI